PTPAGSPYADHFAAIIPEKRHASKAGPAAGHSRRPDPRSPEPAPDRALVAALAGPADPFDRGAGGPAREGAVGPASLIWEEAGGAGQPSPAGGTAGRPGLVLADSAPGATNEASGLADEVRAATNEATRPAEEPARSMRSLPVAVLVLIVLLAYAG